MDDLRRTPPPYPSLAVRQRGNAISVRQKPDQDGGWGTLHRPKALNLPLLGSARVRTRLGYEAEASTEVWAFTAKTDLRLQVTRHSEDRYANCVAVALVDGGNRRVAPLVATASGVGEAATVPPGYYKLVVSLGVAEQVQVELELSASPARTLQAAALLTAGGLGTLLTPPMLVGRALIVARGLAALLQQRLLGGKAAIQAGGRGVLREQLLAASATIRAGGTGALHAAPVAALVGHPPGVFERGVFASGVFTRIAAAGAQSRLATVQVLQRPDQPWRARRSGGTLELNGVYFRLDDPAAAREQLREAGL